MLSDHTGLKMLRMQRQMIERVGVDDPYFKISDGISGPTITQHGRPLINFSSYNYLGLAGDHRVSAAAKDAIDMYGTSVSASRLVSGERGIHQELESALAEVYGVPAALSFVSGHATNVSMLGYLFGRRDLIVHDWLAHNSILEGIRLSGATRIPFKHQDLQALDEILTNNRHKYRNVLVVVEGLYSMDGDFSDLPALIALKAKHDVLLMVDEAHGLGVLGATGRGLAEHWGVDPNQVDIWMGTLSKSLASCGGYVAGSHDLIDNLRHSCPGFLYSVGLAPANAAAALCALKLMLAEPERVMRLQQNGQHLLRRGQALSLDTGLSMGYAISPIMVGEALKAVSISNQLIPLGFNVLPIIYPAVEMNAARLRIFLSSEHTEDMIDAALSQIAELL